MSEQGGDHAHDTEWLEAQVRAVLERPPTATPMTREQVLRQALTTWPTWSAEGVAMLRDSAAYREYRRRQLFWEPTQPPRDTPHQQPGDAPAE